MLLHETDQRHGAFDFDTATGVPKDFQPKVQQMLADIESIGWERRGFKQEAVLNQVKRRFYESLASTNRERKKI